MRAILHRVVDEALRAADTLGDLVADVALGFGAVAPVNADPGGDAPDGPSGADHAPLTHAER